MNLKKNAIFYSTVYVIEFGYWIRIATSLQVYCINHDHAEVVGYVHDVRPAVDNRDFSIMRPADQKLDRMSGFYQWSGACGGGFREDIPNSTFLRCDAHKHKQNDY